MIYLLCACTPQNVNLPLSKKLTHNNGNKTAIIFIHGFTGNGKDTWTNTETLAYWPELLTKDKDFRDYDVYSITYYSQLSENRFTLKELGIWLNIELESLKVLSNRNYENLIFLTHSMGNLVLRSAIYEEPKKYNTVKIPLIISFGSPSEGNDLAATGELFFADNKIFSNLSSSNNNYLDMLNEAWHTSKGDTKISCAYEKISFKSFGLIVSEKSATAICTETGYPIVSDHINMVKPRGTEDRVYIWTKNEILSTMNSRLLQSKVNFENIYSKRKCQIDSYAQTDIINNKINYEQYIEQIKQSLTTMNSSDVADYLITVIPKIEGGITCYDLSEMLSHGFSSHASKVIIATAPYIRRPLSKNCLKKLGSQTFSSEAANALKALIESKPAYQ